MTQILETAPKTRAEQEQEALERNHAFLTAIQQLYETNRGQIAALKRGAGETLAQARGLAWFEYYLLRYMQGKSRYYDSRYNDNLCLLVASLMTFDRQTMQSDKGLQRSGQNFGATLRSLRSEEERQAARPGQTPLERRLVMLLDSSFDEEGGGEMAFRLRHAVKFALAKNVNASIDWPLLLQHLLNWNRPDKRVQKEWARNFYAVPNPDAPAANDDTPDSAL